MSRLIHTEWERLSVGEIKDGQFVKRVGSNLVGATIEGGAHQHEITEVNGLQAALDGKSAADHTHEAQGGVSMVDVIDTLYPVGALYVSTLSTNPGTLLGRGTWAAFGSGRVMVGHNASDADFDTG